MDSNYSQSNIFYDIFSIRFGVSYLTLMIYTDSDLIEIILLIDNHSAFFGVGDFCSKRIISIIIL